MFAAIDLGSNSFRLYIGKYEDGGIQIIKTIREPNRLAAGLDTNGFLSHESIRDGIEAIKKIRAALDDYPDIAARAVATNTLRIALNANVFLKDAEKLLGLPIEIISGEEEGRLIYLGVANILASPDEQRLVIDIGGGSTELIRGRGQEVERVESFNVGTVKQGMSFFPGGVIEETSFQAAILSARSHFEDALTSYRTSDWKMVYGSSGTIRAIADIIAANQIGDGQLTLQNLELLRETLIQHGSIEKLKMPSLRPMRTFSIIPGLSILLSLMRSMNIPLIKPVEAGLRMGVMWDLYLQATQWDRREQSVHDFMVRFQADKKRADCVADLALVFYDSMDPDSKPYRRYMYWSALLHEVGIYVSPTNYQKHGAYLIENADLAGFTTREQVLMSKLLLGQKDSLRQLSDFLFDMNALKALLALRLAIIFSHAHAKEHAKKLRLKVEKRIDMATPQEWQVEYPTLFYWLERERDWWEEVGVDVTLRMLKPVRV